MMIMHLFNFLTTAEKTTHGVASSRLAQIIKNDLAVMWVSHTHTHRGLINKY